MRLRPRRVAILVMAGILVALAPLAAPAPSEAYGSRTPFIVQNVGAADLRNDVNGICSAGRRGDLTHVMKNFASTATAEIIDDYLAAAAACHMKAFLYFAATVQGDHVYPARAAHWAAIVRDSPVFAGYVSVKEPAISGISGREIRQLYRAWKTADPRHPVMALFNGVPYFGAWNNPYTAGMADIVMIDWYPVETADNGCAPTGVSYRPNGPRWFLTKVLPAVRRSTPGVPIYVMVGTHAFNPPGQACHSKQTPPHYLLDRQIREALRPRYGGISRNFASGIAFHTWSNSNYTVDILRRPILLTWMAQAGREVHAGILP